MAYMAMALVYVAQDRQTTHTRRVSGGSTDCIWSGGRPGFLFVEFDIPTPRSGGGDDDGKGDYFTYRSRTKLGAENDIIIALYGQVNIYTKWLYWLKDSMIKQNIMLADKSGLRKKGDYKFAEKEVEEWSDEKVADLWSRFVGGEVKEVKG